MLNPLSTSILHYLVEEVTDAILIVDAQFRVVYANAAMVKLSGHGADVLIGESLNVLLPESVAAHHDDYVRRYLHSTQKSAVLGHARELTLRHRTGATIPIELKAVDLGLEGGTRYFGAIMIDLRRRNDIEAKNAALLSQLAQQALTDSLTGLPNRRAFDLEAASVMAHANREAWPVTVGIVDIDWFKKVNDQFGHATGDAVLRGVAQAIQTLVRSGDLFGRIGGEEFGLLMPRATAAQATAVAERIRSLLANNPIALGSGQTISVTISIGLAPVDLQSSFEAALAQADAALYQAKLTGRNRVVTA